jgi:hypothetical protein
MVSSPTGSQQKPEALPPNMSTRRKDRHRGTLTTVPLRPSLSTAHAPSLLLNAPAVIFGEIAPERLVNIRGSQHQQEAGPAPSPGPQLRQQERNHHTQPRLDVLKRLRTVRARSSVTSRVWQRFLEPQERPLHCDLGVLRRLHVVCENSSEQLGACQPPICAAAPGCSEAPAHGDAFSVLFAH